VAGQPRNVGIDTARGATCSFSQRRCAGPESTRCECSTLHSTATRTLSSAAFPATFGSAPPGLSSHRTGRTIHDYPLVETLTPHQNGFAVRCSPTHDIRFAKGQDTVEDEHFSMPDLHASKVGRAGGRPSLYFYRRRRVSGRNLGDTRGGSRRLLPRPRAVLDVVDEHVPDPPSASASAAPASIATSCSAAAWQTDAGIRTRSFAAISTPGYAVSRRHRFAPESTTVSAASSARSRASCSMVDSTTDLVRPMAGVDQTARDRRECAWKTARSPSDVAAHWWWRKRRSSLNATMTAGAAQRLRLGSSRGPAGHEQDVAAGDLDCRPSPASTRALVDD